MLGSLYFVSAIKLARLVTFVRIVESRHRTGKALTVAQTSAL
jgi:hypothetical protein